MSEVANAEIHGHGVARRVHTVHRFSDGGSRRSRTHYCRVPTPASTEQSARRIHIHAYDSSFEKKILKNKKNPREASLQRLAHRLRAAKRREPRSAHVAAAAAAASTPPPPHTKKRLQLWRPTRIIYPATKQEVDSSLDETGTI